MRRFVMRRLLTTAFAWLLMFAPASAQVMKLHPAPASGTVVIGAPVSLGATAPLISASSLDLTVTANANTGQFIGVMIILGGGRTPSFSDSAGNSYTAGISASAPGVGLVWFAWAANPAGGLTSGSSTISVSWTGGADEPILSAFQVSGLDLTSPLDVTVTPITGTSTASTPISPPLSITPGRVNVLIVAATIPAGNAGTYTTDTGHGFANVNKNQQGGGGALLAIDAQVVATTSTVLNAPSWVNTEAYTAMAWTLKGA